MRFFSAFLLSISANLALDSLIGNRRQARLRCETTLGLDIQLEELTALFPKTASTTAAPSQQTKDSITHHNGGSAIQNDDRLRSAHTVPGWTTGLSSSAL